jgi:hypothetical protein
MKDSSDLKVRYSNRVTIDLSSFIGNVYTIASFHRNFNSVQLTKMDLEMTSQCATRVGLLQTETQKNPEEEGTKGQPSSSTSQIVQYNVTLSV